MSLKQFLVIARPLPTEAIQNPPAVRVQVFAPDEVIAKSKFWTIAQRIARLKKSHGEILAVKHVIEPEPQRVKTYGIWLTYKSTRASHNVYKEYRDVSTENAVEKMHQELAGTHNCNMKDITIIRVSEISNEDITHKTISQFTEPDIKFPITKQPIRASKPSQKRIFSKVRPTVCGF